MSSASGGSGSPAGGKGDRSIPSVVDEVIDHYETNVGPLNGAKVIARAWTDAGYRQRLLANGTRAVAELGFGGPEGPPDRRCTEHPHCPQRRGVHSVFLLSMARAGAAARVVQVAGLPLADGRPATTALLSEMGLELPSEVLVRVWDSSAEARYLVISRAACRNRKDWTEQNWLDSRHARLDDRGGAAARPSRRRR